MELSRNQMLRICLAQEDCEALSPLGKNKYRKETGLENEAAFLQATEFTEGYIYMYICIYIYICIYAYIYILYYIIILYI
jgi:hypothetical protein